MSDRNTPSWNERSAKMMFQGLGQNFMTPHVIRYGWAGPFAYELSKGEGIDREPIYGVTVIEKNGTRRHDLSRMAGHTLREAEAYIQELKEKHRQ